MSGLMINVGGRFRDSAEDPALHKFDISAKGYDIVIGKAFSVNYGYTEPGDQRILFRTNENPRTGRVEQGEKQEFIQEQLKRLTKVLRQYSEGLERRQFDASSDDAFFLCAVLQDAISNEDDGIEKFARTQIEQGRTVEAALHGAYEILIVKFKETAKDAPETAKFADDIAMQRNLIAAYLADKNVVDLKTVPKSAVLIADQLPPTSEIDDLIDRSSGTPKVKAIVCQNFSEQSHAYMLLTALGIMIVRPAGDQDIEGHIQAEDEVIVSGMDNKLYVKPKSPLKEHCERQIKEISMLNERLAAKSRQSAVVQTRDGVPISIYTNYEKVSEEKLRDANPVGYGLVRSEMLFKKPPDQVKEEEWLEAFRDVMIMPDGNVIESTIRLIDTAGDKSSMRRTDEEREIYEAPIRERQMRALLLLYKELMLRGEKDKLGVIAPMIRDHQHLKRDFQAKLDGFAKALELPSFKLGTMIELPTAVADINNFKNTGEIKLGTNDLEAFSSNHDRYDDPDAYDPASSYMLEAYSKVANFGKKTGHKCGVCGRTASDPLDVLMLIGAGFTNLSVDIKHIPVIKEIVSRSHIGELKRLSGKLVKAETKDQKYEILGKYLRNIGITPKGYCDMNWNPPEGTAPAPDTAVT